jgi:hypothetical protein
MFEFDYDAGSLHHFAVQGDYLGIFKVLGIEDNTLILEGRFFLLADRHVFVVNLDKDCLYFWPNEIRAVTFAVKIIGATIIDERVRFYLEEEEIC